MIRINQLEEDKINAIKNREFKKAGEIKAEEDKLKKKYEN